MSTFDVSCVGVSAVSIAYLRISLASYFVITKLCEECGMFAPDDGWVAARVLRGKNH